MATRFKVKQAKPKLPTSTPSERVERRGGPRAMPRIDLGLGVKLTTNTKMIHTPTPYSRHQVTMMSAYGIQQRIMAKILRINEETLRRHYEEEIELGRDRANIVAAGELFKMVTMPRTSMVKLQAVIKWLNSRHSEAFRERQTVEHTGKEGGPIETENVNASTEFALDDSERAVRLLQLLHQRKQPQE